MIKHIYKHKHRQQSIDPYIHKYTPENMRAIQVSLLLLLLLAVSLSQSRRSNQNEKKKCHSIGEIPMCGGIGYDTIGVPNFREQYDTNEINEELSRYGVLLNTSCSNSLGYLLCSIYAPLCVNMVIKNVNTPFILPPCRSLCEQAVLQCREAALMLQDRDLPLGYIDCSNYPTKQENPTCFGPDDPSTLPPMKIKKPFSCDYQATEIETNSAVLITKNNESPSVTCTPPVLNTTTAEAIKLSELQPNTHYNCTIEHETEKAQQCTVTFTTLPPLSIDLHNDTPDITNNSIYLEFKTNRKVNTLDCHLLSTTDKRDCLTGSVKFEGLSPGYYTIRIVAETGDGERATLRMRARVLKGPGYCTVNLINRQWTLDGNELSVWFEGHPQQDQFECKVNKVSFNCTVDPTTQTVLWTVPLTEGKHRVQVSPINTEQCKLKRFSRTIIVTV